MCRGCDTSIFRLQYAAQTRYTAAPLADQEEAGGTGRCLQSRDLSSMPNKTEKLFCNFVGDFKVGDNLVRNARSLCKLMETNEGGVFNRVIVVQAASIIEAALDQIIYRAKTFNLEGVPNISEAERLEIEGERADKFYNLIEVMKKYKILDGLGADVYSKLQKLRAYRNRVHIQNDKRPEGVPREEHAAFTDDIRTWALKLNVKIIKHLNERYPRPEGLEKMVDELVIPSP
jgi:hypothetical protein